MPVNIDALIYEGSPAEKLYRIGSSHICDKKG